MTFGTKLRLLRENTGHTQNEVAEAIGVSRPSYSHYENDWNKPDMFVMTKLAEFYRVPLEYLSSEDDEIKGETITFTEQDIYILQLFHTLSEESAKKVLEYARLLLFYQDRSTH